MFEYQKFKLECKKEINNLSADAQIADLTSQWMREVNQKKYSYHFEWLGRPIIQYPQDMIAVQELIWAVRPDLIIETGIAHGGSLIMSASLLAMIDYCDAAIAGEMLEPTKPKRKVVGVDIDIRGHNRLAIEEHPMSNRIEMIEGSSTDVNVINQVKRIAYKYKRIIIFLDANHTHEHVLSELEVYGPLASVNSYCVVFDTIIEDLPNDAFPDRPWGKGNNPKTAVHEFLNKHPEFEIDRDIQNKLLITVAPDGYLKKIR